MRLALSPRADRLLAPMRRINVYSALELLLLTLLAVQCARLFWALVTPIGPVGEYKALERAPVAVPAAGSLAAFDPFFRAAPGGAAGPVTVTSLDIRLFGVREDRATGRGSAFLAGPDGVQRSVGVGEEIMPGVVLSAVGFDFITISRGGVEEQLFLDQSGPTPGAGQPAVVPQAVPVQPGQPVPVQVVPAQTAPAQGQGR